MAYTEFESKFLVGCYHVSEELGEDMIPVAKVFDEFNLELNTRWIDRALESFVRRGLCTDTRTIGGGINDDVWLNSTGYQEAERLIRAGLKLRKKPKTPEPATEPDLPPNVRKLPSGSTYVVEGEVPEGFGQDGDVFLELALKENELSSDPEIAELEAKLIPASNREVTIYHNQSDAGAALADLERSIPALSKPNDPDSLQMAMNAKSGVQYVQNCKEKDVPVKIGIFRFLVVEPFKRALDSSLDDAWKVIIKGALLVLLGLILVGLGII